MASASSSALSISSSSTRVDAKAPRQTTAASPQCVTLPTLPPPPVQSQSRPWKTTAYCRKFARNVMAMATGEAPAEVATAEMPEIVKKIQDAWDKVEDKYAVSSLAVALVVALWGSTGLILAIDRLPLVPGVLELVGIGYSGWFAYKNLVFKPDREALVQKVRDTYKEITGSS
ncbi:protein CURVATURE THYLAKOID 1B, chloroplastic [Herrania umbratica]|uniref:Protein CURVATURE THYLAKOID 1B, chloroplastic n=1 Tax=Herrania umbratica TaxID=108875 RepID=A0A6J1A1H2_9ROSI|nr:protein CURVATURE THYLAKOID 1B, chloroplastic [Herrania umbratica]